QSLKADTKLKEAFHSCLTGQALPVKLFFNKQIEIDYSKAPIPKIYQDVFKTCNVEVSAGNLIKNSLNYLQCCVSFNYVPRSDSGVEKLFTQISIMHDFRALEALKKSLPQVYSEMSKRALISEAGIFYLLDSVKGSTNA
ncbi:MAG: hypothetical protein JSW39_25280, partial [Desulfobacterales bacterium]